MYLFLYWMYQWINVSRIPIESLIIRVCVLSHYSTVPKYLDINYFIFYLIVGNGRPFSFETNQLIGAPVCLVKSSVLTLQLISSDRMKLRKNNFLK